MNKIKLKAILERINNLPGPFVIVARPHSGTRLLAETFAMNDIFMGLNINEGFLDSESFYYKFIFPLITSKYFSDWDDSDDSFKEFCDERITDTLNDFFGESVKNKPWGWKMSETIFIMPIIKKYFPNAKFIHLVRDGRDVILSDGGHFQLSCYYKSPKVRPSVFRRAYRKLFMRKTKHIKTRIHDFYLKVTFNDSELDKWNGVRLDRKGILRNKYLIQMQSWIQYIKTARRYGESMKNSYYEMKYENLCNNPVKEVERLFKYLNIKMKPKTKQYLTDNVSKERIGKWKNTDLRGDKAKDFKNAVEHGKLLLKNLGYV